MQEEWRQIKDWEGIYEVSNLGNVKRVCKASGTKTGFIKPWISTTKYYVVSLTKNNTKKKYKVHRLVAQAFLMNQENKGDVNHIDNNRLNNNLSNLEWCTRKENMQHASRCGRMTKGEQQHNSKLKEHQVIEIIKSNLKPKELAAIYGVQDRHILRIKAGERWAHIKI